MTLPEIYSTSFVGLAANLHAFPGRKYTEACLVVREPLLERLLWHSIIMHGSGVLVWIEELKDGGYY